MHDSQASPEFIQGAGLMKYLNKLLVFLLIILLSACSNNDDYPTEVNDIIIDETNYENNEIVTSGYLDENYGNSRPYAFRNYFNKVSIIDLTTGVSLNTYLFDEYEIIHQIWNLDNGYIVALVGYENLFSRESRLRMLENNNDFDFSDIEFDDRTFAERNFRFLVFDVNLNILTTTDHSSYVDLGYVKYSNGQVYAYDWVSRSEEGMFGPWDLQRINLLTGESSVVLVDFAPLNIMGFIDNDTAILNGNMGGETGSVFRGILNVNTGEKESFGIDEFIPRAFISNGANWIITEANTRWFGGEITSQVFVLNADTMIGEMVQLIDEDSYWARLGLDGDFIVALDQTDSIFRKYDLNGNVVSEIEIELPVDSNTFEIFPITNEKHLLSIQMLDDVQHLQIIILP